MIETAQLQSIIEAALFAANKPMSTNQLAELFDESERPAQGEIKAALKQLQDDYDARGVQLLKLATGYAFRVHESLGPWVSKLWDEKPPRYSRATLETLAIIAYRQPITRGEIEAIRGVSVNAQIVKSLQERDWVRVVGHKDVPGKPELLATTKDFLAYFNLGSLDQLPPLAEIKDLDEAASKLEQEALKNESSEEEGLETELADAEADSEEESTEASAIEEDDDEKVIAITAAEHEDSDERDQKTG